MRHLIVVLLISLSVSTLIGQGDKNQIRIKRDSLPIKLDGKPDEAAWLRSAVATNFTQLEPNTGAPPSFQTEVNMWYNDYGIYVYALMKDPEPRKILKELTVRDQEANADKFSIAFDTYKDGINAFVFEVSAAGVQSDSRITSQSTDSNWDAVWESQVLIGESGWSVEMIIPYNALRFSKVETQSWGMQLTREIRRYRETSTWAPIDPTNRSEVNQYGELFGLASIKAPFRLNITPYVTGYYNFGVTPNLPESYISNTDYTYGLDLKMGLSDAYTLDMTLIPDFGQTISDNNVLNVSPFEIFFPENRTFFTEGLELFNKGRLFYTRRVGGSPLHYQSVSNKLEQGERLISNPNATTLYNATKVSGRNSKGMGIGIFNAISAEEYAIIGKTDGTERSVQTQPHTNYNVVVVDQNLKNNSYISLMNTNVYRFGPDYDANVTGAFTELYDKNQLYGVKGSAVMSHKISQEHVGGYTYNIEAGKYSGEWTYGIGHGIESHKYDPNDLGFLFSPNSISTEGYVAYNQYTPKYSSLNRYNYEIGAKYNWLYVPLVFDEMSLSASTFYIFNSRNAFGINTNLTPRGSHDYFEPRRSNFDIYLPIPESGEISAFFSSDYRKVFAYDIETGTTQFSQKGRNSYNLSLSPRVRVNDHLSITWSTQYDRRNRDQGYVNKGLVPELMLTQNEVLIGQRQRDILTQSLTAKYSFSANMGLNLRVRHYWDKISYTNFYTLQRGGKQTQIEDFANRVNDSKIYDNNTNFFNVDFQYQWRYAPGSDIFVVWKNNIFNSNKSLGDSYFTNLDDLFSQFQNNSVSLRLVYFLDYQKSLRT